MATVASQEYLDAYAAYNAGLAEFEAAEQKKEEAWAEYKPLWGAGGREERTAAFDKHYQSVLVCAAVMEKFKPVLAKFTVLLDKVKEEMESVSL